MALVLSLLSIGALILSVSSYENCNNLADGTYNIRIVGGVSGTRQYLSTTSDGGNVDLWTHDDHSGRQQWRLTDRGSYYTMQIYSGVSNGRDWLSTTSDGTNVDLWYNDDASGRQRWKISKSGNGDNTACNIEIYGGVSGGRTFLSTTSDGTNVDLWTHDDGSSRQRWRFERANPTAKSVGGDIISDMGIYDNAGKNVQTPPQSFEIIINSNGYWFIITCMAVVILLIVMNVTLCYKLKMGQNIRYKPVAYDTEC